jgi:tRNA(fMet)-specific endonuclease VapC
MFVVLDTNHYTELTSDSLAGGNAQRRIETRGADVFISIISVQESVQGWLSLINRKKAGRDQLHAYARFQQSIETLIKLTILPFDEAAARIFENLQRQRLRVGTMDLKIAAICLAHEATLLTRNLADFEKVPGLRVENWLDWLD